MLRNAVAFWPSLVADLHRSALGERGGMEPGPLYGVAWARWRAGARWSAGTIQGGGATRRNTGGMTTRGPSGQEARAERKGRACKSTSARIERNDSRRTWEVHGGRHGEQGPQPAHQEGPQPNLARGAVRRVETAPEARLVPRHAHASRGHAVCVRGPRTSSSSPRSAWSAAWSARFASRASLAPCRARASYASRAPLHLASARGVRPT
mmetsp:Transcript_77139/g.231435  ORF Transcript_77139/g.231435 Transcript_77139/m.231435 type:complete len:209 (-) Transcript_77139:42-668(-)